MRLLTVQKREAWGPPGPADATAHNADAAEVEWLVTPLEARRQQQKMAVLARERSEILGLARLKNGWGIKPEDECWLGPDRRRFTLLRLGERIGERGEEPLPGANGGLRTLDARRCSARGRRLAHAPYSHRVDDSLVPSWIVGCRALLDGRRARGRWAEREQHMIAMAFYAQIVLRRWRWWARAVTAGRRRRQLRAAWRQWRLAAKGLALREILRRLLLRNAVRRLREGVDALKWAIAVRHHRLTLLRRVWHDWLVARRAAVRRWFDRWVAWLAARRARRRILAGALRSWRRALLGWGIQQWSVAAAALAARDLWRDTSLGQLLRRHRLRRCFNAFRDEAACAAALRRLLDWWRGCRLRRAWEALRAVSAISGVPSPAAPAGARLRDGRRRQGHCRCVYDICRGGRCRCRPTSHLLRRVEELHRLVAYAMESRDYRVLSHVTQYSRTTAGGIAAGRRDSTLGSGANAGHGASAGGGAADGSAVGRRVAGSAATASSGAAAGAGSAKNGIASKEGCNGNGGDRSSGYSGDGRGKCGGVKGSGKSDGGASKGARKDARTQRSDGNGGWNEGSAVRVCWDDTNSLLLSAFRPCSAAGAALSKADLQPSGWVAIRRAGADSDAPLLAVPAAFLLSPSSPAATAMAITAASPCGRQTGDSGFAAAAAPAAAASAGCVAGRSGRPAGTGAACTAAAGGGGAAAAAAAAVAVERQARAKAGYTSAGRTAASTAAAAAGNQQMGSVASTGRPRRTRPQPAPRRMPNVPARHDMTHW